MAGMTTVMRGHQKVPTPPAMAISAWFGSIVIVWLAVSLAVSAQAFVLIASFGVVQNAFGLILYAIWSRKIRPPKPP